ncbi:MAG: DUF4245 domain-containing protein [Longispora sp.]|nr:DUF4245 domain-containing protein [Longispora sp. (in: high G+C Gram-positive bacteria)]
MSQRSAFSQPPGPTKEIRSSRKPRDMAYSLLALLIPIVLMVALYRFLGGESPTVVDPEPVFADARSRAGYQVLAPDPTPTGWQATTATATMSDRHLILRVGYIGPNDSFLQLTESGGPADGVLVDALEPGSAMRGSLSVNGKEWQLYTGPKGIRALVISDSGRTIVLAGRASEGTMSNFAGTLR